MDNFEHFRLLIPTDGISLTLICPQRLVNCSHCLSSAWTDQTSELFHTLLYEKLKLQYTFCSVWDLTLHYILQYCETMQTVPSLYRVQCVLAAKRVNCVQCIADCSHVTLENEYSCWKTKFVRLNSDTNNMLWCFLTKELMKFTSMWSVQPRMSISVLLSNAKLRTNLDSKWIDTTSILRQVNLTWKWVILIKADLQSIIKRYTVTFSFRTRMRLMIHLINFIWWRNRLQLESHESSREHFNIEYTICIGTHIVTLYENSSATNHGKSTTPLIY